MEWKKITNFNNYSISSDGEVRNENRKKKILAAKFDGTEKEFNSRTECAEYFKCNKSQIEYNKVYTRGLKKGWSFRLVKDIV